MWVVVLYLAATGCAASAQPILCTGDHECGDDYYCEKTTQRCLECLQCTDLKREPPINLAQSVCVKSIVDCGPCFKGLVVDHRGDVNAECVSPESQQESPILPIYVWVLIAIAVVIGITLAFGFYLYRKPETFKVWASTSIRSLFVRPSETSQTVPDLPPPYNPDYNYMSNTNPSYAPPADWTSPPVDDTAQPFIKRAPSSQPQDARENADNQRARIFNRPAYYYQDDDSVCSPEPTEHIDDKDLPPSPPWMPLDEDTEPSAWTPQDSQADNNAGNSNKVVRRAASSGDETEAVPESDSAPSSSLALLPAAPTAPATPANTLTTFTALTASDAIPSSSDAAESAPGPSSAKRACIRQDSKNNRNRDSSAGASASASGASMNQQPTSDTQTALFINVIINNNK